MRLEATPTEFFEDAYVGRESRNSMIDFAYRLKIRRALLGDPSLWFWTPAYTKVIGMLKDRFAPGATVLEIGCGLGFFMHELRRQGFNVVGLDVAKTAAELNERDGFPIWHGTVTTAPSNWMNPDAVVLLFMLHHLTGPLGFLKSIAERWPNRPLLIAQHGPSNLDPIRSEPPRTLTRWGAQSLSEALRLAGYLSRVVEVPSTGIEHRVFRPVYPIMQALKLLKLPDWTYRNLFRIENRLLPRILGGAQKPSFVLVAEARPFYDESPVSPSGN
jgi:SAM-dependent methyltransferase